MPTLKANAYGPYLRFGEYKPIDAYQASWTGSVLYVTHSSITQSGPPILWLLDGQNRQMVHGRMLDSYLDWSFWRFDLNLVLTASERRILYWVDLPSSAANLVERKSWNVTLPGAGQQWRWGAYSCSGYSSSVDRENWGGENHPMFQDLLKQHAQKPFHALVGGGDQLYNDAVFKESQELVQWLTVKNRKDRLAMPFSNKMAAETEWFYFTNYCDHFAERGFREALASIPNVMIWDDHDIFDGWGSYPDDLLTSHVFQGIYQVACRFYLMFQHHSTWQMVMGGQTELFGRMGPINHVSFNFVKQFGPFVALIGVDIRAERTKKQVVSKDTWEMIFARIRDLPTSVQHVVVLLTVPILYPKVPLTEMSLEMLSIFNRVEAVNLILQKTGLLSKIMAFDEPELLDDLMDHWTAGPHMEERSYVVNRLQGIAELRGFRIMFLSGDVHAAAIGQFYSDPKKDLAKDPKYMPQIISSAIINAPPPNLIIKMMHVFNIAKSSVNSSTKEKMVRTFKAKYKNTDKVMGRRNYLMVEQCTQGEGGLLCTLRLEDPAQLGVCESFRMQVPPLVDFHRNASFLRKNTFPPQRPVELQQTSGMSPFPYVDTLETANALGAIGSPTQRPPGQQNVPPVQGTIPDPYMYPQSPPAANQPFSPPSGPHQGHPFHHPGPYPQNPAPGPYYRDPGPPHV